MTSGDDVVGAVAVAVVVAAAVVPPAVAPTGLPRPPADAFKAVALSAHPRPGDDEGADEESGGGAPGRTASGAGGAG